MYKTYELEKVGDEEYSIVANLKMTLPLVWNTWKSTPSPTFDGLEIDDNQYYAFIKCVLFPSMELMKEIDAARTALLKLIKTPPTMFEG